MLVPRFYTLWAINGELNERRLFTQLDQMRAFGFNGTVFHPRFYPGRPPYLSDGYMAELSRTILHAKSIGMDFWIYDEDGWPSGTVGGRLLRQYPQDAQQWADLVANPPDDLLGSFDHDGRRWYLARRRGAGVDYLNPELTTHFIQLTYERYRQQLDPAAFAHVSAFFCDEPEFGLGHAYDSLSQLGSIPWTARVPELFESRYGQPLVEMLPLLFFPGPGEELARVRFWELLTDLFCDSFIHPLNGWCQLHGKRLAAHVKGEEHPLFQVPMHGSAQQVFRHLSLPGIDALGRDPSNDFFPRQLASAARQFGDGRSMVECFGGAGWGATQDDLRRYLLWLGGHGITDYVLHLWQYQLDSHAIHDWPASIPNHIGWADAFPQLLRQLRLDVADAAARSGVDVADTLLVSPHRGIMETFQPAELLSMNIHDGSTYPRTPAGEINQQFMEIVASLQSRGEFYHTADERTLESGAVDANALRIGNCKYRRLLLPPSCRMSKHGELLIQQLQNAGVSIQNACAIPPTSTLHDVVPAARSSERSASCMTEVALHWQIVVPIENAIPLDVSRKGIGQYRATFDRRAGADNLALVFMDAISNVTVNGQSLTCGTGVGGAFRFEISDAILVEGRNAIALQCTTEIAGEALSLAAWIVGSFVVKIASPLAWGPNLTQIVREPLTLTPARAAHPNRNLTATGYPFVTTPVTAKASVELPCGAKAIRFAGIAADAARVVVNNRDCGFVWAPDWVVALPEAETGKSEIVITLYPSAYNTYGPHHHFQGDRHIVSPAQFSGIKNFADDPSAPSRTHIPDWHLKPLHFPSAAISLR